MRIATDAGETGLDRGRHAVTVTMNHPHATEQLQSLASDRGRRKRRRLVAWSIFGILGILLGSVWAAGLATSTTTSGTESNSPVVMGSAGTASVSPYSTLVGTPGALSIGFSGRWGYVPSDADMFQIDLTGANTPAGQTFFTSIYLSNVVSGWSALQLKLLAVKDPSGGCTTSTSFASPVASSVMNVTSNDAEADFTGLLGGSKYCIGVQAINPASDTSGTFLRRPNSSSTPTMPNFVAMLNRST